MDMKAVALGAVAGSAATLGIIYLSNMSHAVEVEKCGEARAVPVIGNSVVHVGSTLVDHIPGIVLALKIGKKASKIVIVSDETVYSFHGERLKAAFAKQGVTEAPGKKQLIVIQIKPGEKSKDRKVKEAVEDELVAKGCKRDTLMLALGGGVVGDLTGFIAATYMRGVPVVQIPTSVMAMVDSSVGGKTAINVPAGKNLIGAFHQVGPNSVFAECSSTATLHANSTHSMHSAHPSLC
jgi:pentafunctional AROM polypeptide